MSKLDDAIAAAPEEAQAGLRAQKDMMIANSLISAASAQLQSAQNMENEKTKTKVAMEDSRKSLADFIANCLKS